MAPHAARSILAGVQVGRGRILVEEQKRPKFSEAWHEARKLVWSHRHRLLLGLLLLVLGRLAAVVLPGSSKFLIDDVLIKGREELLPWLALAVGLATLVQALTGFILSQVLGVAGQRVITDMRKDVQAHITRLPLRYFDTTQTGVLISRVMNDAEGIRNLIGNGLVQLFGGVITAAVAMGVLFYLNWQLTVSVLVILALFGGGMALGFTRLRPIFRERGKLNAEVTGRLAQTFSGIRVVKAYTAEKRQDIVFAQGAHALFRNVARTITGTSAVSAFSTIVIGLIGTVMIMLGGRAVLSGAMSPGDFVAYIFFTGLIAAPVIQIASIGTQLTEAFAGLDRIREIRHIATEDGADGQLLEVGEIKGAFVFEQVSFEYVAGTPVLSHVSFTAPAGSTTALVGPSGSGKSTLIGLIMGFNRPTAGRITVDGRDLTQLRLREYREHLGVVLQDDYLFDGTIAENIGFACPHASAEEIRRASRIAHCDEFIARFEQGYETVVGERGVRLSGGQRQRVAIARAIVADPRILILDEATSSLDSESEALIQDGLRALRQGRTTFVIAHRLSTIQTADQILVLEGGAIVERGGHGELLAKAGRYKQLYDKQYGLERNRFINPGEEFNGQVAEPPRQLPRAEENGRAAAL